MKKNNLIIKVDCHRRGKIYVGKKWLKDVCSATLIALPRDYTLIVEQYLLNEQGCKYVVDNEVATKITRYKIKG